MNEKYGIELQAIVNKFKATMQSTAKFVKNIGQQMQDDATFTPNFTIDTNLTKKELEKFKEDLEKEISNLKGQIELEKNISLSQRKGAEGFYTDPRELAKYEYALDLINKRLQETNKEATKSDVELGEVFEKGTKKIKKFSIHLLGARTAFSLFRKYQSIYFQYNEQMQYQTELSNNAIALSLAPTFELLGNVIAYASIGFARFIELLTGVNVLSKVTTKGIRDYNKSLKETQILVSGIDEITNLTTPQTTGLLGQYQALEEFRKKVDEVTKAFKENPFLKAVVELVDYIKENWDWLKWVALGTFLTVGTFSLGIKTAGLASALGTASAVPGAAAIGTGLAGLSTLLMWLAGIGTIALEIYMIYKIITEGKENLDNMDDQIEQSETNIRKTAIETYEIIAQKLKEMKEKGVPETDPTYQKYLSELERQWNLINQGIANGEGYTQSQIDRVNELALELRDITGKDYTITLDLKPTTKKSSWQKFKEEFLDNLGINKSFGHIFGGFGHAKGLDYVPYDNYPALLHKGEAVVPAKYNPAIHSAGNDYTNSLLETLIVKMDDLASRPNVFEVDGQKFASATYELYKGQENRQNYNTNVVVR